MTKIDVHQHLWTVPLLEALAERRELPFVRRENGQTVLFLSGERPYVLDGDDSAGRRIAVLELDGLDRAFVCLSSPVGIEALPREESLPLLEAFHEGALAPGQPFGVWGAIALRMGAYFVGAEGVLARRPMSPEEELQPLQGISRSALF
jgi:hypothetical protein